MGSDKEIGSNAHSPLFRLHVEKTFGINGDKKQFMKKKTNLKRRV